MSLRLTGIRKRFEGVAALDGVDCELLPGEVHGLVGENGAGKSTLINVMGGVHEPDDGTLKLDGKTVTFRRPRDAVAAGISTVPQERHIVPDASVAENVFLNRLPRWHGLIDYSRLNEEAGRWLGRVGLKVDPQVVGEVLSPGQGQMLEIARAMSLECRYLLLDEPTASIGPSEAEQLFRLIEQLKESGHAVLFVSHKLDEVFRICDRVSVIRDGKNIIAGTKIGELTEAQIIEAMVGREFVRKAHGSRRRPTPGAAMRLEARGVATRYGHHDVSFKVCAGEIVALYGLVGAGRTELARALVGLEAMTDGEVLVNGKAIHARHPSDALRKYGVAYISEDRRGEGLILDDTIARNVSITIWDRLSGRGGFIAPRSIWPAVRDQVEMLDVKMASPRQCVGDLSGGNQQKVSVAKWLAANADILILDEPTVGVDVKAKDELHGLIGRLAEEEKALLVISSDLREVVDIADRVVVMVDGEVCSDMENDHDYDEMSRKIMMVITKRRRAASAGRAA